MTLIKSLKEVLGKDNKSEDAQYGKDIIKRQEKGFETRYAGEWSQQVMDRVDNNFWLGYVDTGSDLNPVRLSLSDLQKHLALFGDSGYGKTTVVENILYQWDKTEYGMCVVDTRGGISEEVPEMTEDTEDIIIIRPGDDTTTGLNFFETYTEEGDDLFEEEVDSIVSEFINLTNLDEGATSNRISEIMLTHLIKSDTTYTPLDFYQFISSEEGMAEFIDTFNSELTEDSRDSLETLADEGLLRVIQRRVYKLVEQPIFQNLTSDTEASDSISNAVATGKSIFIDLSEIHDREKQKYVTEIITRQLWATLDKRTHINSEEYEPYSLVFDELPTVDSEGLEFTEILTESRSVGLSVILTAQELGQMNEDTARVIENNCSNILTSRTEENQRIGEILSVDPEEIVSLSPYQFIGTVSVQADERKTQEFTAFAEYPPRQS